MTTFARLAAIYDDAWEIVAWKGDGTGARQRVVLELRRRAHVEGHSHANWLVEGGYIDEPKGQGG